MGNKMTSDKMWCVIGEYYDPYGYEEDKDDIIALFTTEEKAKDYIEKSKLKTPNMGLGRVFKQKSLLSTYKSAFVQEYEEDSYEVDPEL